MDNLKRPRRTRVMLPGLGSAVALIALAGCQSYDRVPLELTDHRASLDARLVATEPISKFVERLSEAGNQVPERFDPNDGLSPAEGEVLAMFYNPDLRLARLRRSLLDLRSRCRWPSDRRRHRRWYRAIGTHLP